MDNPYRRSLVAEPKKDIKQNISFCFILYILWLIGIISLMITAKFAKDLAVLVSCFLISVHIQLFSCLEKYQKKFCLWFKNFKLKFYKTDSTIGYIFAAFIHFLKPTIFPFYWLFKDKKEKI
jgi:hypothetical protein